MWRPSSIQHRVAYRSSTVVAAEASDVLARAARQPASVLFEAVQRLAPAEQRALALALQATSADASAVSAGAHFRAADANRDGVLSPQEFHRWYQNAEGRPGGLAGAGAATAPPTRRQLFHVMLRNGVPFVGFGFLDNAGMIVFGEYIDDTLGAAFQLSTMASAGLGNAVSDVFGLSFGKVIEAISIRLGLPDPMLSEAQSKMRSVQIARFVGTAIGLGTGCLLGLTPLLFYDRPVPMRA